MAKKSSNKRSGYKNKAQTAKNGKGKQGNKPRNTKGTSKRTTPQKQQPVNIYIVNEKDKGGKREDKRVEEREEQATGSKSWLDYLKERRAARLEKKQEKEQKKRVNELKASTKKTKKGSTIVSVHKSAKNNAGNSSNIVVKRHTPSGGSNHSGRSIFRVLKTPLIVVLCIALLATVVYLINTKTGNKEGDWPWNIHEHYDKDGDHWCDKKGCGKCIPVDEDEDGYCDICNVCIHIDEDGDCVCDRCDNEYHEDENRNNECDNCGKEHLEPTNAEVAVKAVGDFFYNVMDKTFGAIRAGWDWTKDTFKDIGERIASVMPDWMLKERSDNGCEHIDENGNGVCDECLRRFREKEDTSCVHVDADNSGRCDICDAIITGTEVKPSDGDCAHVDISPKDGKCDKCGNKVAEGEPSEPSEPDTPDTPGEPSEPDEPTVVYTVTFHPNGGVLSTEEATRTTSEDGTLSSMPGAYLDGYEFIGWYTAQEDGTEITLTTVFTSDTTVYAQWTEEEETCVHIDENGDRECDLCGFEIPNVCIHRDADDDGYCEYCGEEYDDGAEPTECEHRDADDDGKCDKCGEEYDDGEEEPVECEHIDETPADYFCDKCGAVMVNNPEGGSGTGGNEGNEGELPDAPEICTHRDANDDGLCDKCGETFSDGDEPEECEHRDADDDGNCDKCGETFSDGDEPEECEHRDANDDGFCDKCGETFSDGDEPEEPSDPECEHRDADDDGYCDKCGDAYDDGEEEDYEPQNGTTVNGDLTVDQTEAGYAYSWSNVEIYDEDGNPTGTHIELVNSSSFAPWTHNLTIYENEYVDESLIYFSLDFGGYKVRSGIPNEESRYFTVERGDGGFSQLTWADWMSSQSWGEWLSSLDLDSYNEGGLTWYQISTVDTEYYLAVDSKNQVIGTDGNSYYILMNATGAYDENSDTDYNGSVNWYSFLIGNYNYQFYSCETDDIGWVA